MGDVLFPEILSSKLAMTDLSSKTAMSGGVELPSSKMTMILTRRFRLLYC